MARYIDTEKVHIPKGFFEDLNVPKLLDWLKSQPTADVVEVKHGHWIETDYRTFDGFETVRHINEGLKCSVCNHVFRKKLLWCDNYCPECGAKMDLKEGADDGC